ncbi:MAG: hypothetical protein ACFCD0_12180 [Gemmataceae bacterium]
MTEAEWYQCKDLHQMMRQFSFRGHDRKWRLFAVACCKHFWPTNAHEMATHGLSIAKKYADGVVSLKELVQTHRQIQAAHRAMVSNWAYVVRVSPGSTHRPTEDDLAVVSSLEIAITVTKEDLDTHEVVRRCNGGTSTTRGRKWQRRLLRCVFANPTRTTEFDAQSLSHDVLAIAKTIFDESRFDHLPILADALEESGCNDGELLDHCREKCNHVPGCWVLDLILGKG